MKNVLIGIIFVFLTTSIDAQITHQSTYWARFYVRVKLDDKWSVQTELDNRRFFGENKQLQFITHTHLHRKLGNNTEGSIGFTYSNSWQGNLAVPELRPFQEFYFFNKIKDRWRITHRFRTEQRWFRNFKTDVLTEGYNFKFRFRYMLRAEYRLSEKWLLRVNDELMYHHDDFDQNRYYGGVEYKFLKDLSLEIGYLKVYQKRSNNKGYFDRDNLRMTIYKDF